MASYIIKNIDISKYDISKDLNFLRNVKKQKEEYDEFGQGFWQNISLLNSSGDEYDSLYQDGVNPIPTEVAKNCPTLLKLIEDNFNFSYLKMARTRNLIDGMVIPHRDFIELNQDNKYFRVFIPLELNSYAFHSDESGVFQMLPGEIWFLDASLIHSAINYSTNSRIFLCLDFIFNKDFTEKDIFINSNSKYSNKRNFLIKRNFLTKGEEQKIINSTSTLISKITFKDLLFMLAKYHFNYDIEISRCFNWLIESAKISNDKNIINKSINTYNYLVKKRNFKEKFNINDW